MYTSNLFTWTCLFMLFKNRSNWTRSSRLIYCANITVPKYSCFVSFLGVDEDIQGIPPYYVNGDASVSCSHDIISTNQDLASTPSEPVRLSTASTFCSTKRLPALYENSYGSYRQRVVMSGIRMKLLNSNRRPRSTEPTGTIAPSIPYNSPSDPNGNVSFIIKNINSQNNESEHNPHERR